MKNIIMILLISSALISCSSEVKSDPQGTIITTEAFKTIESIKEAYLKKNIESIQSLATDDTFRLLKSQIKTFNEATLTFTPLWVETNDETIQVQMTWEGSWKQDKKTINERGVVLFVLLPKTYKLSQILRSSPFILPE
jgi:hypothetical protein